jgi:ADP-ribose pyrophosphatase YjhB (NUDIX family)
MHSNKLLMCRRANEPARGAWIVPSGFLESGETLQEAAARETFEETGVVLDPQGMHLHSIINLVEIGQVVVVFRSESPADPVLEPGDECLEVAFLSEMEIVEINLAWPDLTAGLTQEFFTSVARACVYE